MTPPTDNRHNNLAAVPPSTAERPALLTRARRLATFTIAWNIVEGAVALSAAWIAGSRALAGFGLDSALESISATILLWRLRVEQRDPARAERVEHIAVRAIGIGFIVLAGYVAFEAIRSLTLRQQPGTSTVGIGLTLVSLIVMPILATQKRIVAVALGSRAAKADSAQTWACTWLSAVVLVGLILNATLGWWWADPIAALIVVMFLLNEGREALTADHIDDCC